MRSMKTLLAGIAVAVGLLLFVNLRMDLGAQSITTTCSGGAWLPNVSCAASGVINFLSGIQTSGTAFNTAIVTLTDTQVKNLATIPVTIIPVPPSGYVHIPLYGTASFNEAATYAGGSDLKLWYSSRADNAASGVITFAGFLDTATSMNVAFTGVPAGPEPGKTAKAVTIEALQNTAITSGNAANSLKISVQYLTVSIGTLR